MKLYVAGKYESKDFIQLVIEELRLNGYDITFDWTRDPIEDWAERAKHDLDGVRRCDCLVVVALNPYHYRGTLGEIGAALALGKPVIIIGPCLNDFLFSFHPLVTRCNTVGAAIDVLSE